MGRKKRIRKTSVFGVAEGRCTERNSLDYLDKIYRDKELISLRLSPIHGGTPDRLINEAIKNLHFDKNFVWLDEDKEPTHDTKLQLAKIWKIKKELIDEFLLCPFGKIQAEYNTDKRNPIVIVSQPVCVESLIIRTLGHKPCISKYISEERGKQILSLRNSLDGILKSKELREFYEENLTKELLDERRKTIFELDLLISMLTK